MEPRAASEVSKGPVGIYSVPQAASEVFTGPVGVYSVGSAEKRLCLRPWLAGCRINLLAVARGWSERRDSLRRAQETGWLVFFQHLG